MIWIIIVIVLVVLVVGFGVMGFNRLRSADVGAQEALGGIDVQLTRRADLIPNLVETVKGYAGHERGTLEAVISARNKAVQVQGGGVAERAEAEGQLTQTLSRLFALTEAYPQLKANENFGALQEELGATENRIGFSRQHYNDVVARYEESRQAFPTNIVAGAFNFDHRDYFKVEAAAEREAPKVSFT